MARKSKKQPRQIVHPRCAGIDIGSREHWVAVDPDRSARCLRLPLSYAPPRRCPPATSSACEPATTPFSAKPKPASLPVPAVLAPAGASNNPQPATSFGDCASPQRGLALPHRPARSLRQQPSRTRSPNAQTQAESLRLFPLRNWRRCLCHHPLLPCDPPQTGSFQLARPDVPRATPNAPIGIAE